jgi:Holliday junction resolvase
VGTYRRGREAEIEVADLFRSRGYDVVVSSLSKGAADLVAWHDGEICMVQVKASDKVRAIPRQEREQLLRMTSRIGAYAIVATRVKGSGGRPARIVFGELTEGGPPQGESWIMRGDTHE